MAHWPGPWLPDWAGPACQPRRSGGAVGHNPISILIPLPPGGGADGSLTGYAGGIDKKLWLLDHEGWRRTASSSPTTAPRRKGGPMERRRCRWVNLKNPAISATTTRSGEAPL